MTTTVAQPTFKDLPASGTTFVNVLRSEWVKLWSVRSTAWTLFATTFVTLGFTTLIAWGSEHSYGHPQGPDPTTFDPTSTSLAGIAFGQLAMAVLGTLVLTSEYSSGGIRTTFTAVPQRLKVIFAKFLNFAVVSLVVGLINCFACFYIGQLFYSRKHIEAHLGDPHVLRAVIGGGFYLMGSGLFGFALGALLRKTAAAVSAAAALLFVLPLLSNALPGKWGDTITHYFTSNAGGHITDVLPSDGLGPYTGYAVFTVEWAIVLALGAYLIRRNDA
jgi:ABC-2 type transport system permease protein